jgi:hypothetical protein
MNTKFQISQNTTFTPPMIYPSAWRRGREQKSGSGGVRRRRAPLV